MMSIWQQIELYYHMNGSGILCCCPVDQYSSETYFYEDDVHKLDDVTRSIIEHTYNLAKMSGYQPDLYESTIVCTSVSLYPFLFEKKLVCIYIIDRHQILMSTDIHEVISADLDTPCVWVYLWVS